MAVKVFEASSIQKALVHGFIGALAASSECPVDQVIDPLATINRQLHDHLSVPGSARDFPFTDGFEYRLDDEHDVDVVTDAHTAHAVVAQRLVERKAKAGKELD